MYLSEIGCCILRSLEMDLQMDGLFLVSLGQNLQSRSVLTIITCLDLHGHIISLLRQIHRFQLHLALGRFWEYYLQMPLLKDLQQEEALAAIHGQNLTLGVRRYQRALLQPGWLHSSIQCHQGRTSSFQRHRTLNLKIPIAVDPQLHRYERLQDQVGKDSSVPAPMKKILEQPLIILSYHARS